MNFDEAIDAHVNWKLKLRGYINGSSPDKLDPSVVEKDNACALGKWIYGEGTKYKTAAEYETLRTEHAKFHKAAAQIVRKVDSGDKAGASSSLDGSDYSQTSSKVVNLIMTLRKKVG